MWPYLHAHPWCHPNTKVQGWNQRHPWTEALQCKYPHLYFTLYGDTAKGQWNSGCLHSSPQIEAKQCAFDNDTVAIYIFVKGLRDAPTMVAKIYEKDPQTLAEVIKLVSMMSSDNRCFVCGCTGHFGCHCPDAQCYGCDEFGHFAQDCPHKIPPSGMPCHHSRSHSRHWYTHDRRDRSHFYYGPRHSRHFSRSQSHPCSHHDRSSSFRRYTSYSSSSHNSCLHHPSANGCSHHLLYCDTNRYSHTPSCTHHFSHRCHSHHSIDWSQFCFSNSHCTIQGSQARNVKQQCPRPTNPYIPHCSKTVTSQDSPSDSSSDSDSDSDPLSY